MKEMQVTATTVITIKEDGEVLAEVRQETGAPNQESDRAAGAIGENDELTEEEAERYAVASDLANVCDWLEESEVIKIRLIVQKAAKRKERQENG